MNKKDIFQRRVVKFLTKKGFNCVTQPKNAFPDIIAWRPLMDQNGNNLKLYTQMQNGKTTICIPFFVAMVECKEKYLKKEKNKKAKELLDKGSCNVFLTAYRAGRKLEFHEFFLKPKGELKNEGTQSYIG